MSPLFSTVGKLAYGLVTNWHGLIFQKLWTNRALLFSDFIATRRRWDNSIWVCYRLDNEELPGSRQKKEEATVLVVGLPSLQFSWCQRYLTRLKWPKHEVDRIPHLVPRLRMSGTSLPSITLVRARKQLDRTKQQHGCRSIYILVVPSRYPMLSTWPSLVCDIRSVNTIDA